MNNHATQIRKLRIAATDESAVHKAKCLLADAFSTASLPGLPPSSLVMVRHLHLGRFSSAITPASLAQVIDKKVYALASSAICIDEIEASEATVVWMSDKIVAHGRLIKKISEHSPLTQWYWQRLLEPHLSSHSAGEIINHLFGLSLGDFSTESTQHKLVNYLFRQHVLPEVLNKIDIPTATHGLEMVAGSGLQNFSETAQATHQLSLLSSVPGEWQLLASEWLHHWGNSDPRSHWLIYNILVQQNPALQERENLSQVLNATVNHVLNIDSRGAAARPRVSFEQASPIHLVESPESKRAKLPVSEDTIDNKILQDTNRAARDPKTRTKSKEDDALKEKVAPGLEQVSKMQSESGVNAVRRQLLASEDDPYHAHEIIKLQPSRRSEPLPPGNKVHIIRSAMGDVSEHAGLLFIVTVMQRLGLETILHATPALADNNFPAQLLTAIADRLGIPDNDPVRNICLNSEQENYTVEKFNAPAIWQSLLTGPGGQLSYRAYLTEKPRVALIESQNKEIVIRIDGCDQKMIREPGTGQKIAIHSKKERLTTSSILRSFQLVMARYLWRYASISMRQLVSRRALISVTNTHLDATFAPEQADIRLRLLALDVDPRWVPWLGRVIQYHYDAQGVEQGAEQGEPHGSG